MISHKISIHILMSLYGFLMISQLVCGDTSSEKGHDPPKITPNFYDPNYHDDGRNHLRGPTASSSASTISVISPYHASASSPHHHSSKPSSQSGPIMAIVDHYYGPNGEEKVQYTNPEQMDREELDQILQQIGTAKLTYGPQHDPPPYPHKPHTYVHPPAPQSISSSKGSSKGSASNLYKSSSSPSYASTQPSPGFSLGSLYKSSAESYAPLKPAPHHRPAYSTIYKDPPYPPPPKSHYSKGEYSPAYSSHSPPSPAKEPLPLHSPPEPSYLKGPPYYASDSPPKSISEALAGDHYSKGHPSPYPRGIPNGIENDDPPSYYGSPSYPAPPPSHYHHSAPPPPPPHHEYTPSVGPSKDEYGYGKGHLKAGFHSLPMKHSPVGPSYDYGSMPPPPPLPHHEMYSSGFGGGYSSEEPSDPYSSRPSTKGYSKPPYSSSPAPPPSGHSLSSLYESNFDDLYTRSKPFSSPAKPPVSSSKPSYGHPPPPPPHPSGYTLAYGSPVEYHMPPKGPSYSTSSSPYSSGPYSSGSKYKGPYRTVNTGPSSYYGYGYGKPHGLLHGKHEKKKEREHKKHKTLKITDGIEVDKDSYEDEPRHRPPHAPLPSITYDDDVSPPPYPSGPSSSHPPPPPPPPTGPSGPAHPTYIPPDLISKDIPSVLSVAAPLTPASSHHHHHHHHHDTHSAGSKHPKEHHHHHHVEKDSSDEVVNIHIYEKGFFEKEKQYKEKENDAYKWRPVIRDYHSPYEGGLGSASMEREGPTGPPRGRGRGPPPSRRRPPHKSNKRPYHKKGDDEDEDRIRRMKHTRHFG